MTEPAVGVLPRFEAEGAAKSHVRGSSLLLAGRVLSMLVNMGTQVLIVRYLSKTSYGAFAYALSLVMIGETVAGLGLDKAVTRYVPIYDERGEYRKLAGSLVLAVGTTLFLGLAMILLAVGLRGPLASSFPNAQAITLVLILSGLAPVQALDNLLLGMFGLFAKPRAIFFRKHVLAPGLRLLVVLLLIAQGAGAEFLALGYVVAGAVGVVLYGSILVRILKARGLFDRVRLRDADLPIAEMFAFTLPLLSTDLMYVVMNSTDALLLGHFAGAEEIAAFRAVQPAARLNQLVMTSFTVLFLPMAARMFARDDRAGITALYWQSAAWLAVLSFPILALTFSLAPSVTVALYGEQYAGSAPYLALLSFGYYVNCALGFNGTTLKVFGKLRYVVGINVAATVFNLALNLALIPALGALGAAIGTATTLVLHNVLKQYGLRLAGIPLFDRRYARVYVVIAATTLALLALQLTLALPFLADLFLAAAGSLVVLVLSRPHLDIAEAFPELLRFRLGRLLLGNRR